MAVMLLHPGADVPCSLAVGFEGKWFLLYNKNAVFVKRQHLLRL